MTFPDDASPAAKVFVYWATPFDQPYGTPASETPWYQSEGYPIYEAILRTTFYALPRELRVAND